MTNDQMTEECVFADRGYRCVWYQCADCGWYSHSADERWSARAAEAHAEALRPGHRIESMSGRKHEVLQEARRD